MDEPTRQALEFLMNIGSAKTERPNDIWSTIYHVASDALDGHTHTLDELRGNGEA